jgi:hypothetical protein
MPPIRCSSEPVWWLTTDQDLGLLELHARHYSKREYADGREVFQCLGPGEKVPLRTHGDQWACDAIWGWRKFIDDCIDQRTGERQQGINCAFFRNEGPQQSSELVRQADAIADALEAYDVIDLSAHGPRRGLLVAVESIHETHEAPALPEEKLTRDWVVSKGIMQHVLDALDAVAWSRMAGLVKATGHSKESVRAALQRLVREGFVEVQAADESHYGRPRREWRRVR